MTVLIFRPAPQMFVTSRLPRSAPAALRSTQGRGIKPETGQKKAPLPALDRSLLPFLFSFGSENAMPISPAPIAPSNCVGQRMQPVASASGLARPAPTSCGESRHRTIHDMIAGARKGCHIENPDRPAHRPGGPLSCPLSQHRDPPAVVTIAEFSSSCPATIQRPPMPAASATAANRRSKRGPGHLPDGRLESAIEMKALGRLRPPTIGDPVKPFSRDLPVFDALNRVAEPQCRNQLPAPCRSASITTGRSAPRSGKGRAPSWDQPHAPACTTASASRPCRTESWPFRAARHRLEPPDRASDGAVEQSGGCSVFRPEIATKNPDRYTADAGRKGVDARLAASTVAPPKRQGT
jgi:hypothetical protein